jgi:hypothetical protein
MKLFFIKAWLMRYSWVGVPRAKTPPKFVQNILSAYGVEDILFSINLGVHFFTVPKVTHTDFL